MTHYDTLQIVPWAKQAVIKAAYRALMREYHPDTNREPGGNQRAGEIAAAFAVLGDPKKRAAYDRLVRLEHTDTNDELAHGERDNPDRRLGRWAIGSIPVAALLSLGVVVGTDWPPQHGVQHELKALERSPKVVSPTNLGGTSARSEQRSAFQLATAPAHPQLNARVAPDRALLPPQMDGGGRRVLDPGLAEVGTRSGRTMAAVQTHEQPRADVAEQLLGNRAPARLSDLQTASACGTASPRPDHRCEVGRQQQIERLATSFLQQSLDHADWHKQELLFSARVRAATTRAMCHSDECVAQSYLRQISDTTTIMAGRIPPP